MAPSAVRARAVTAAVWARTDFRSAPDGASTIATVPSARPQAALDPAAARTPVPAVSAISARREGRTRDQSLTVRKEALARVSSTGEMARAEMVSRWAVSVAAPPSAAAGSTSDPSRAPEAVS